jgi:AcrR family transcriptional regulator
MSKGERTRKEIIEKAFLLAGNIGLEALSVGALATQTGLSKSGLFAHFKSKEALQLEIIDEVITRFTRSVIRPALAEPRGEPRLRVFFEHYLDWIAYCRPNGGCVYMALCQEYADRPGPVRDRLIASQVDLRETLARVVQTAKDEGHFRADLNVELFTFEFTGIKMAYHDELKFLRTPGALSHARAAFEDLLARSRVQPRLT